MLHFHTEGGNIGINLPRTICDLNLAWPVHLAVIDGIKNATGVSQIFFNSRTSDSSYLVIFTSVFFPKIRLITFIGDFHFITASIDILVPVFISSTE